MKKLLKKKKEEVEVPQVSEKEPLSLNLDLGRQDLNDNFRKIQDAINNK